MQELFPPLRSDIIKLLQNFPSYLDAVMPLQAKHRRALPFAIEELSSRLTVERGLIKQAYWSAPRLTSAYLWYFLPWNILRLSRLLSNLKIETPRPMPTKADNKPKARVFMDMGSGPLSFPIALWLAKPQWRDMELQVLCVDSSPHPLQLGQSLFYKLAGEQSPWKIIPVRAKLEAAHLELHKIDGVPWLISAANVCNEIKLRQGEDDRSYKIMENLYSTLKAPDSSLIIVEPGTRLGGKTIVNMREAALECGLAPISPCPHMQECPLETSRTWCHFTFDTKGAPKWLNELSAAAKLRKDSLSLAFIHLQHAENIKANQEKSQDTTNTAKTCTHFARIVSAPFNVPSLIGDARYACAEQGLTLIKNATALPSGSLVKLKDNVEQEKVDAKSGAIIVDHAEKIITLPAPNHTKYEQGAKKYSPKHDADAEKRMKKDSNYIGSQEKQERQEKKQAKIQALKNKKQSKSKKFWEK